MTSVEAQGAVKIALEVLSMHRAGVITDAQARATLVALGIGVEL